MEERKRILAILFLISLCAPGICCAQSAVRGVSISRDAPPSVKEQVERLHSFDPVERRNAAEELGEMGEEAVAAVPILIRALSDSARLAVRSPGGKPSPASVAEAAMLALQRIGVPAVESLIAVLGSQNPGVRMRAATALGNIDDPRTVVPLVRALESDEDPLVRAAAVDALRKKDDERALEALLLAEQNESWVVRSLAKSAVEERRGAAGPKAPASPPAKGTDEDPAARGGAPGPSARPEGEESSQGPTHVVQRDETLYRIGRRYGVTWQTLMEYNDLRDPTDLYVGQVLRIPPASDMDVSERRPSPAEPDRGAGRPFEESGGEQTHVVQQGDTLYRIGLKYGVSWQTLMNYNRMHDPNEIYAGQELKIPPGPSEGASLSWDGVTTYTVQHGDILSDIGLLFGLSWREVAAFNGLEDPNDIFVGQVLKIPTRKPSTSPTPEDTTDEETD